MFGILRSYVAGAGRGADSLPGVGKVAAGDDNTQDEYADDAPMFMDASYEQDDKEADLIYAAVDKKMDTRRKKRREDIVKAQLDEYRKANPKISQMFTDIKRDMEEITEEEWSNIPDIGDANAKKRKKMDYYTPVTDSLLSKAQAEAETMGAIESNDKLGGSKGGLDTPMPGGGGLATPMPGGAGGASTIADLTTIGDTALLNPSPGVHDHYCPVCRCQVRLVVPSSGSSSIRCRIASRAKQ